MTAVCQHVAKHPARVLHLGNKHIGGAKLNHQALLSFIWSVADLLRGNCRKSDYGQVILALTVLRRLDCILALTKEAVLAETRPL
jgi:hypothetical protein